MYLANEYVFTIVPALIKALPVADCARLNSQSEIESQGETRITNKQVEYNLIFIFSVISK